MVDSALHGTSFIKEFMNSLPVFLFFVFLDFPCYFHFYLLATSNIFHTTLLASIDYIVNFFVNIIKAHVVELNI